jgi:hypothetical protein
VSTSQVDHSLRGGRVVLIIFGQPPVQVEPGERALHHPSLWKRVEAPCRVARCVFLALHYLQQTPQLLPHPLSKLSSVGLVSPHNHQPGKLHLPQPHHQFGAISVLHPRRVYFHTEHQAHRVHQKVALAAAQLLGCIVPSVVRRPPFSVVLTVWVSTTPPLGSGLRPARVRTSLRKVSLIRSNRPSLRQWKKYQYTMRQGGRSCGSNLQEHPVLSRYRMALTISRRGYLAGRPPFLGAGIRGSSFAHSASVRSVAYSCLCGLFILMLSTILDFLLSRHRLSEAKNDKDVGAAFPYMPTARRRYLRFHPRYFTLTRWYATCRNLRQFGNRVVIMFLSLR